MIGRLKAEDIEALLEAALACGLEQSAGRHLQFAGLPAKYAASLKQNLNEADQLRHDLNDLAQRPSLEGVNDPPLALWLQIAVERAEPRPEAATFRRYLTRLSAVPVAVVSQLPAGLAPYRGLAAFEAEHAQVFLGRDAEIDELVQRLDDGARLITIVAASGSGKSSLVRAGLVPKAIAGAFGGGPWATAVMKPGDQACDALAEAVHKALPAARGDRTFNRAKIELTEELREAAQKPAFAATLRNTASAGLSPGTSLLLVVDQFEELFTLSGGAERTAFVANLIEATQAGAEGTRPPSGGAPRRGEADIRIVLTMRADFTGHFLQEPALGAALLQSSTFYLGPMAPEQLRVVVETPAHLAGYRFEPGLVDELVSEALGEPGHLPLLAFVLDQLWQRRDTDLAVLRWTAYRALGGLRGAINAHAEAVVARLDPDHQRLLRDIFGYLVTPGQGAADTRHRATRADLEALGPGASKLIDTLVDARLLTTCYDPETARDEIEVAHEALIREWTRLRGWIEAEREGLVLRRQIDQAAAVWVGDPQDRGNRWQGGRLQRAVELRDAGRPPLTANQRAFVDACQAAVEEEARAEVARHRLTMEALTRAQNAVRLSIALKLKETDPAAAALALIEVTEPDRSGPTVELLMELAGAPGRLRTALEGHTGPLPSAVFSPDGKRIVTASDDNTARVWNADGMGTPVILQGHTERLRSAAFSPDGKHIVTASYDGTARVWNADGTGTPVTLQGHTAWVWSAAFSPDGKRIVTASKDNTARVWNADGTGTPVILQGHTDMVHSATFSPDGTRIVTASHDKTAGVWNADGTGTPVILQGHTNGVTSAAFSPDGKRIVTASFGDRTARAWNADGAGPPVILQGHTEMVRSAAFSPDGKRIVTASDDRAARVWNADGTGTPVILQGHTDWVHSAAFSPDGKRIVTASEDRTARVWNADGTGTPVILQGHTDWVHSAAFSPEGKRIVTASKDGTARVWNAEGMANPLVLQGHTDEVRSAAFSPDGKRIVTASEDRTARVWSADGTGTPVVLRGHTEAVVSAAFSLDASSPPPGTRPRASGRPTARAPPSFFRDTPMWSTRQPSAPTVNASSPPPTTRQRASGTPTARAPPSFFGDTPMWSTRPPSAPTARASSPPPMTRPPASGPSTAPPSRPSWTPRSAGASHPTSAWPISARPPKKPTLRTGPAGCARACRHPPSPRPTPDAANPLRGRAMVCAPASRTCHPPNRPRSRAMDIGRPVRLRSSITCSTDCGGERRSAACRISTAVTAAGAVSMRSITHSSGWMASTWCCARMSMGKSLRLKVIMHFAPAWIAAANTCRSSGSGSDSSSISASSINPSGTAAARSVRVRRRGSASSGRVRRMLRKHSSRIWLVQCARASPARARRISRSRRGAG